MACKKSDLVSAINTFAAARLTNDSTLVNFSMNLLTQLISTLEFGPEEASVESKQVEAVVDN